MRVYKTSHFYNTLLCIIFSMNIFLNSTFAMALDVSEKPSDKKPPTYHIDRSAGTDAMDFGYFESVEYGNFNLEFLVTNETPSNTTQKISPFKAECWRLTRVDALNVPDEGSNKQLLLVLKSISQFLTSEKKFITEDIISCGISDTGKWGRAVNFEHGFIISSLKPAKGKMIWRFMNNNGLIIFFMPPKKIPSIK